MFQRLAHGQERAAHVDGYGLVEILELELVERSGLGYARIGYDQVDAPEELGGASEGVAEISLISHIALERLAGRGPEPLGDRAESRRVDVDQDDVSARREKPARHPLADRTAASRHQRDLPCQWRPGRSSELRLLQAPVLHVEEIAIVEAFVVANRGSPDLRRDRVLGDVRGDPRGLARIAGREEAEARKDDDPGCRIERHPFDPLGLHVAPKVHAIGVPIAGDFRSQLLREGCEIAVGRALHEEVGPLVRMT